MVAAEASPANARQPKAEGRPRPRRAAPKLVHRKEATSSAYRRVRDLIVSGRLGPGAPLVEVELSQRLGVSRTPVRAALQRLQQEGFVTASRAGSKLRASVASLTAGDLHEIFLIVGALESAAARLAAGLEPRRRAALSTSLGRLASDLRHAIATRPPDLARAHGLRVRFHRAFTQAAVGPRLRAELDVLQPQAERYQRLYAGAVVDGFDEAGEHEAIVAAIRTGDEESAERAVKRTWRESAERHRQIMTILGERGNW